ncbi:hypothetical protein ACGFZS_47775, partial [Streptomyces sp. NPDC048288]
MPQPTSSVMRYEAGDEWLADSSADPKLLRRAWDTSALAPLDAISVGVILRQSGVMTAALVERMAPEELWTL